MAKKKKNQDLPTIPSEAFLAAYGDRLNTIGRWSIHVYDLDIIWHEPAALSNNWVPFDLRFQMESDSFDPDERMFELWEFYRPQHKRPSASLMTHPMNVTHINVSRIILPKIEPIRTKHPM